jgi:V/A-type H+-transporting ATPase subunit D
MSRIARNKGALQKEREQLRLYERVLPSLDLKRRQLIGALAQARNRLDEGAAELERRISESARQTPMLANTGVDLDGMLRIEAVELGEENLLGARLPVLERIECRIADYSRLAKPHWVDVALRQAREIVERRIAAQVEEERVKRLSFAVKRITQRVNLFEKMLIPTARDNIRRIRIFLADAERAAVVQSKISKARHRRRMPQEEEVA